MAYGQEGLAGDPHACASCVRRDKCCVICRNPFNDAVLLPARNMTRGRLSWRPLCIRPYHHIACTVEDRFFGPAALAASLWEIQSHHAPDILARSDWRLAFLSSVLVRDLPKSAKDMLVVEFTDLEIGSAAERY
jgi:hypothetical protein